MKTELLNSKTESFEPIVIKITIESLNELESLYGAFNTTSKELTEMANKNSSDFYFSDLSINQELFRTVYRELKRIKNVKL